MRILALTKYGPAAASTRQRFVQYEPALRAAGFDVDYSAMLGDDHMQRLVKGRRISPIAAAKAYARRMEGLVRARQYDLIWLQYEFLPYGPGRAEAIAARYVRAPIVVDYDDAIFHRYDDNAPWPIRLMAEGKLEPLLRRAAACCCGNPYVQRYVSQYCDKTILLPTVVDTSVFRPMRKGDEEPLVIGWIGSPTTWANVRPLLPVLRDLHRDYGVQIRAVGAGTAAEADRFEGLELVAWSEAREIGEVQKMDIGIMPLIDRPFERGKSGYKLIQYMACALPVVASPVGVNSDIVTEGETGFLARDPEQWSEALKRLTADADMRRRMGDAGRRRAEADYSLQSQAPRLVSLFRSVAR